MLAKKFVLYYIIPLMILLAGTEFIIYRIASRQLLDQADRNLITVADDTELIVTSRIREIQNDLRVIGAHPGFDQYFQLLRFDQSEKADEKLIELEDSLVSIADLRRDYNSITFFNMEGASLISVDDRERSYRRVIVNDEPWFPQARLLSPFQITTSQLNSSGEDHTIVFAMPVHFRDSVSGLLTLRASINKIFEIPVTKRTVGTNGYSALIGQNGTILVHTVHDLVGTQVADMAAFQAAVGGKTEISFNRSPDDNTRFREYCAPVEGADFVMVVGLPDSEILAPIRNIRNFVIPVTFVLVLIVGLVGLYLIRHIVAPIQHISEVASIVGAGDLDAASDVKTGDEIEALSESINQMTANLRRGQQELKESQERVDLLLNSTAESIYGLDLDGNCTWCNKTCVRTLGYESTAELLGKNMHDLIHHTRPDGTPYPRDESRIDRAFRDEEASHVDDEVLWRADGSSFPTEYWSHPIWRDDEIVGSVVTFIDITERKQNEAHEQDLESQLRQTQRMEAIGRLAGGIAHDFNNLLQGILGYGEMSLNMVDEGSKIHDNLDQIMKAGERSRVLVSQLLAFSRRQVLELSDLNLDKVIVDLVKMIQRIIGDHISLKFISGEDLGVIRADRGQIEQILINLCVNARDAMVSGGTLNIETSNVELDAEFCKDRDWAKPGDFVLLSVSDTGTGMTDETLQNIFEPFFTTKGLGEGTGLGLSTVFGIVHQHDGLITVESHLEVGTTFKLFLPITQSPRLADKDEVENIAAGGYETILLADDDDMVRHVTEAMLKQVGYTVLKARDGVEAINIFAERGSEIDMALLDVVMPNLGGKAVAEYILKEFPHFPILFSSGYSRDAIHTNFVLDEGMHLIQKPFQRNTLLQKIREILRAAKENV